MSTGPSPLGRYDDGGGDETLHEVRLLNLPVRVLVAGREHHDELMREFALLALAPDLPPEHVPRRLVELTEILGVRYGASAERPSAEFEAAIEEGQETIDLTYQVPGHVVEAADTLERLMQEADDYCRAEQLLTLQRSEVVAQFSSWYLEQFRRQIAGEPPEPWSGPMEP